MPVTLGHAGDLHSKISNHEHTIGARAATWGSRYSVETEPVAGDKAACNACHARVAHLMREGKARTPSSAASLPRLETSAGSVFTPGSRVTMATNRWNRFSASRWGFAFTACVISEAEAREIAQPEPSNATSAITSPSMRTWTTM